MTELFSQSDFVFDTDGEPRIHDLVLGRKLGFQRPRSVRHLIDRNAREIEKFGVLATRRDKRSRLKRGYYLTVSQALTVCMLSEMPGESEVRRALIDVSAALRQDGADGVKPPAALARRDDQSPTLTHRQYLEIKRRTWKLVGPYWLEVRNALTAEAKRRIAAGEDPDIENLTVPLPD